MKHINLTQMLQGCSKRNGMTVSASNPDGEPTVNRQSRQMSLSGKKAKKEQLSPSCLLSASFPPPFRSRYLRYAAVIFCVLAMSVGQAWAVDPSWSANTSSSGSTFLGKYKTSAGDSLIMTSTSSWSSSKITLGNTADNSTTAYNTYYLQVFSKDVYIDSVSFKIESNGSNRDVQAPAFGWASAPSSNTADTYFLPESRKISSSYANAQWVTYDFSSKSIKYLRLYRATKNMSSTSPSYTGSSTVLGVAQTIGVYGIKVWLRAASDSYDIHIGKDNDNYTDESLTNTSGTTWSKTVTLDAGSYYEFKVKKTPSVGEAVWYGNNGKITATTSPAWDFSTSDGNCKLYTSVAGSYTFSWDASTSKLTVTYPAGSHPTKRIYMACGDSWCNDSPKFFVHSWGVSDYNTEVQQNACGEYYADIIWYNDYFQFTRNASNATAYDNNQWNVSQDLTYNSSQTKWTCTGWSDSKGTFSSSAYSPDTYTVSAAASTEGYGTVSESSVSSVPCGTSISASTNTLTVGATTVTAAPAESTAQYTYAFTNWTWSPAGATITSDITATANFTRTLNSYTVTWKNGATTLETDASVNYGVTPTYDGSTPTKDADALYSYAFSGWSPAIGTVTGDATYSAQFTATPKTVAYEDATIYAYNDSKRVVSGTRKTAMETTMAGTEMETGISGSLPLLNSIEGLTSVVLAGNCISETKSSFPWLGSYIKMRTDATTATITFNVESGYAGTATIYFSAYSDSKTATLTNSANSASITSDQKSVETEGNQTSKDIALVSGANTLTISGNNGYISRIDVALAPSCTSVAAPTGLTCSTAGVNSLAFSWTAASNASSYDVYLYSDEECTSPVTPTEGSPYNVSTTSATLTGLTASTTYYCKVQSKGDGEDYCTDGGMTDAEDAVTTCTSITPTWSYPFSTIGVGITIFPTIGGNTGSGTVTYTSSATSYVEISNDMPKGKAAGSATVTASLAATGNYCSGSVTSETITVVADQSGLIKQTLPTGKSTSWGTPSAPATSGTYASDITSTSVLTNTTGIIIDTDSKGGNDSNGGQTAKITSLSSYDADKYMSLGFTVASGKKLNVSAIYIPVQPVNSNTNTFKAVLTDDDDDTEDIEGIITNVTNGKLTYIKFSSYGSVTGNVTLKIYAYGWTDGYRFGKSIVIDGETESTATLYDISKSETNGTISTKVGGSEVTSAEASATVTITATPSDGYSFTSWSVTKDAGGSVDVATSSSTNPTTFTMPGEAVTVSATFSEITHTVSVAAGAHGTVSPSSVSGVGIATASGNITATPSTGYSFNGWTLPSGVTAAAGKTASSNPIQINATADDKTITATWTTVSYTITYNLNSGSLDGSQKTSYNIETEDYDLPTPTYSGHVFQGWYTDDEFTSDRVYTLAEGSTGNKTYYAKWGSDVEVNWTITKVSSKLYKGGTGYTVTAEIDDASWDASGDKDDLVLSASDGVTLSNITKSINGSDKAQVEANFSVAGDVEGDKIYFTLSVPAAGDYSAIDDEKEVELDDCPAGSGSAYVIPVQSSASDPDGTGGMSYAWISDNGYITRGFGLNTTGIYAEEYTGISSYRSNSGASGWMFKTVHGGSTIRIYLKGTQNGGTTISSVYYKTSYFSETSSATSLTPTSTAYYTSAGVSCDNIANGVAGYAELSFSSALADNSFVYFTTSKNTHTYGVSVVGSGGSGGVETSLAWSSSLADKATVNKNEGDDDFQYYASPTPSNAGGPISYTSSDESVATVSSNGTVHIVGDGSTTITAAMPAYGCYSAATSITYSLEVANTCADTPGTIVDNDGNAIAGDKVSRGACETLTLKLTGHTGSTIAWKKDGVTIVGATNASYTIPAGNSYSGVYSATVTGTSCTLASTNSITVTTAGGVDPTIFADEFTVKSGRPFHYRLMQLNKGESVSVKSTTSWTENTDFVITKDADNIVYISSKTYAGVTIESAGTETITLTISNECGDPTDKAITIHKIVATAKPTVAWIATGDTKGEKTCKASESTNTDLYQYLEDYYTMTALNCYWSTSEADLVEEYSKYDLIILTDYPNSGTCPNGKSGKSNSYTNAIGLLIDYRPILTFEAFVAGCPNWGIPTDPSNTKATQKSLTLLCNAEDIFDDDSGKFAAGRDIAITTASSGQALQGFPVASLPDFVFIGKITDSDDKEYVACCERQVNTGARMMVFGLNSALMSNLTNDGKLMVQKFADYLLETDPASIPDCSVIFNGGGSDNSWYTTGNWESGSLPDAYASVRIDKPCEVPYSTNPAKAGSIKIHQGGAFTGSLTIQPRGRMIVEKTITRIEGDEYTVHKPTEVSDLVLETSEEGNGVLIMGSYDGTNKATVGFYTKAKKTGGHNVNQFIGTPFNDENYVFNNYYGTKIYEFRAAHDGDKGTDNEWIRLPNDGDMRPFYGYNILTNQADERTLWMEGTLVASEDQKMKMYYNGSSNTENMFANSWPAPIDIAQFTASDFGGGVATVYIFNAGTVEDYTAMASGSASATSAGQFIVLPIASAPWTSPTVRVIPSMQAFSVFASGSNQTMTLDYDRLVRTRAASMDKDSLTTATRAPRRAAEEPVVMHLRVDGINGYAANMHVLEREDLTDGFDNGWDGHHMVGDEDAPQLYAITEAGKMNVNCVPNMEGTLLGFRAGTDNQFTFSFGYEGEEDWYLNDLKEQKSTLIDDMSSYTFMVEPEDAEARFVISKTPIRQTPTGCESVGGAESAKVRKLIINDKIYIIRGGRMYSVDGQMVK